MSLSIVNVQHGFTDEQRNLDLNFKHYKTYHFLIYNDSIGHLALEVTTLWK